MTKIHDKGEMTRRGFFERSAGALGPLERELSAFFKMSEQATRELNLVHKLARRSVHNAIPPSSSSDLIRMHAAQLLIFSTFETGND